MRDAMCGQESQRTRTIKSTIPGAKLGYHVRADTWQMIWRKSWSGSYERWIDVVKYDCVGAYCEQLLEACYGYAYISVSWTVLHMSAGYKLVFGLHGDGC